MPIYDRFYPESRRERERSYRDPHLGRRGSSQREEEDDRGAWMSRDRDYFEREFRSRDPYEAREWFRDAREPFERFERDRDPWPREVWRDRRRRFEPLEDWERPRELSGGRESRRASGAYGPYGESYGSYGYPGSHGGYGSRYETGGYAGRGPKGYQRSDERLRDEVCDRLTADPEIDASEMTVSAENAEVTLEGTVPTRLMKRLAEECAEEVGGVRQVHNRLRVEANEGFREERSPRRTAH